MSERDERSTHFMGFAHLLYPDLARLFMAMVSYRIEGEEEKARMVEVVIKDVLACRGYDLAVHVFNHTTETMTCLYDAEDCIAAGDIPDMTAWPEQKE